MMIHAEENGDVRKRAAWRADEPVALIANFASVHREPGHEDFGHYETNHSSAMQLSPVATTAGDGPFNGA